MAVCNDADHARMRRLLGYAFTGSAMKDQEPLITFYLEHLVDKLKEQIEGPSGGKVDLVKWYNFTTFDIIGDLLFDQSFECLKSGETHVWVANVFKYIKYTSLQAFFKLYPTIGEPTLRLLQKIPQIAKAADEHFALTAQNLDRRMGKTTNRKDMMR